MSDKIIVTNLGVLRKKYGPTGLTKIRAAITALVAADKKRGLATRLFALDNASEMKKAKGAAVTSPTSPRQNKNAIDAIYATFRPDYLMILGAIDVVPHQDLINPVFGKDDDMDKCAWGDIPYACDQPYSRQPDKFIGPTRVVGRLPDLTGGNDPDYLVGLLRTAAGWKSLTRQDYSDYFAISALPWKKSTSLSLDKLFGSNKNLRLSPAAGPKWTNAQLARRSHFINCHGTPAEPEFAGQKGDDFFPTAHQAKWIGGKIREGTVASVECCYGGELYDPALALGQAGICNTYLANKAYGYFGASTIAYGPAESNGAADLICRYFLQQILRGASLGRAALDARQEFALAGSDIDPVDMKTIAQFNLFGDPSIHPVAAATPHTMMASGFAKGARQAGTAAKAIPASLSPIARAGRRQKAVAKGHFISNTQPVSCRRSEAKIASGLAKALLQLAARANIRQPKTMTFRIKPGTAPASSVTGKKAMAGMASKGPKRAAYLVAMSRKPSKQRAVRITAVIAKELGGKLVSYRKVVSR
jgi:hypothetical protein